MESVKKILIIDDSEEARMVIEHYLKQAGYEFESKESGQKALLEFDKAPNFKYWLILMDLQMPGLNGYETTKELRKRGFNGKIIALSGNEDPLEIQKSLDAGCNVFIQKPISKQALLEAIQND